MYKKQKELEKLEKDLLDGQSPQPKKILDIDLERIKERNENLEQQKKLAVKSKSISKIKSNENYMKYKLKKHG